MPDEKTIGKPDAGNPHVRFERGPQETEPQGHRAWGLPPTGDKDKPSDDEFLRQYKAQRRRPWHDAARYFYEWLDSIEEQCDQPRALEFLNEIRKHDANVTKCVDARDFEKAAEHLQLRNKAAATLCHILGL